jgi:hypothetical protein
MPSCDTCGAEALLMGNVALATGPGHTYRCPQGHITHTDFRSPPQNRGIPAPPVVDVPATSPPPPPPPDGGVAGPPPER